MAQGDDLACQTPQWREAMRRAAIVRGLLDAPSVGSADIAIAAAREGVSRATLYRWIRRWREGERRTSSLVDGSSTIDLEHALRQIEPDRHSL